MSDKLRMEELLRTRFEGAELNPSPESWKAIQRKLRWPQFLRFSPGRFNIYYAAVLLLAATALVLVVAGRTDRRETADPEETSALLSPAETATEGIQEEGLQDAGRDTPNAGEPASDSRQAAQSREAEHLEDSSQVSATTVEEEISETLGENNELPALIPAEPETELKQELSPISYFTTSIQTGCAPLTVRFTNQSIHATSYYWDFGTGDKSREEHPEYEFKEPGRYMVTLTTENHGSLPTVSRMMVEVLESPVADFQIEEGLEGIDKHVVLNLVNYSSNASAFAWSLVDEDCVDCSRWSSLEYQPTLQLKNISQKSRAVKLEVISENGCSDTTVLALPLVVQSSETRIKFATAFSPNPSGPGDGSFAPGSRRIDLFHPIYIEVPVEYRMRIYTRRGELIFETRDVYQGWDGYLRQERAPRDVYVWMVDGKWDNGEAFSMHGDVTVISNQYW